MIVLVLNVGSSTLKFQVIATDPEAIEGERDVRLAQGVVERIGSLSICKLEGRGGERSVHEAPLEDHRAAVEHVLSWIVSTDSGIHEIDALSDLDAVGHRVVHGGQDFRRSVPIDERVMASIEDHIELAPLHNPANLRGIRATRELLGTDVPQVAVFDTAFHATMPPESFLYAIPYHYYRRFRLRRYGFHGTSHRYVAYRFGQLSGREKEATRLITLHLGNGCSACAIRDGESIATSMGFTPLEGLVMGTRSGDVDPAIVPFLGHVEALSASEVESVLNKQSGLLGISGLTSDMRELLAEEAETGDQRARLAIDMFCRRVRHYVASYHVELGGADAVVFTGGIGENAATVRKRITAGLECLGLELDDRRNDDGEAARLVSSDSSRIECWVVPTDEELMIARDTVRIVLGTDPG